MGTRLPKCSSPSFASKVEEAVPAEVREVLLPLVRLADALSESIQVYDQRIEQLSTEKYRHTRLLRQVKGVGGTHSSGLRFNLGESTKVCQEPRCGALSGLSTEAGRFRGLPAAIGHQQGAGHNATTAASGKRAHYILGPFGPDTDLRRYGLRLCERGGKNAKKRAAVAVARKLAVLLHRLWVCGEVYEPLRHAVSTTIAQ
jgi:hypothetical protein